MEKLTPILISGGGRSGSTALMALLGSDPRVVFYPEFPYESRYLTYMVKFTQLMQRPDLHQYLEAEKLFNLNYSGVGGQPPWLTHKVTHGPNVYLPTVKNSSAKNSGWLCNLWERFRNDVSHQVPGAAFYAEKGPNWLAPVVRQYMECFTIYNLRDPRDIFISTNAFMRKRNTPGFARLPGDNDLDHARSLARAFIETCENYNADRRRQDTLLVRYEDYASDRAEVGKRIKALTGVNPQSKEDYVWDHATAKDLAHSINRWKSEPIPEEVVLLLEQNLHQEMAALGYPLSLWNPMLPSRDISFVRGNIDLAQVSHSHPGSLQQESEYAVAHVQGPSFHLVLPIAPFAAQEVKEIWICVSGSIGKIFSLYWRKRDSQFSEIAAIHLAHLPSPHWRLLTFPVQTHSEWKGEIAQLRLHLFNSNANDAQNVGTGRIRWVRLVS